MCGIAGIFGKNNTDSAIVSMVNSMKHRGPDGNGIFYSENISLGHTRLSIIDLSQSGAQPMYSDNGNLVIVYNGEVFNYKNLAEKFLPDIKLKSNTDTEVVLKMYERMGAEALKHFRGMFAFLIWDKNKKELFGARDRLGVKPLYYCDNYSTLIFGSEVKTLLASGVVDKKINKHALVQLFQYGHIAQPNSIIDNVYAVPPASYFTVKLNDNIKFEKYWNFECSKKFEGTLNEACEQFRNEFETAVDLRMVSDRPIGVFLSNGLDSVSLLAALKNKAYSNVETFTIGFKEYHKKYYREDLKAKELSTHFGFKNESIIINPENFIDDFPSFIYGLDQPSIDGFNSYLVSKYTSQRITVALSGLGGDELFMGYPRNIIFYFKQKQGNKFLNFLNEKYQHEVQNGKFNTNKYLQGAFNRFAGYNDFNFGFWIHHLLDNYNKNLQKFNFNHTYNANQECNYYLSQINNYNRSLINNITEYELRTYTLNQLLRDMDAISMYNSMEIRVPFLDHIFIEYCLSLPDIYKFNYSKKNNYYGTGITTYSQSGIKYILGKSYEHLLPDFYLNTPKQGFQLPVYDWAYKFHINSGYDFFSEEIILQNFESQFLNRKRSYLNIYQKFDSEIFLMFILSLWSKGLKNKNMLI